MKSKKTDPEKNEKSAMLAAYHITRDFVREMRDQKLSARSISKKRWQPYEDSLKSLPSPWPDAAAAWTMENLEDKPAQQFPFRALSDQEFRSFTPEAYGQLVQAVRYGMLDRYQAERLIEDAADAGHMLIYPKMMDNILAHIWSLNVIPLKDALRH
jgi:hypothetical protein